LRETLSSDPWCAKQARRDEELTGDPMAYWETLFNSEVNLVRPPVASSTAEGKAE
jgi:hypothetical protein